jgi:hypothetical protein
MKPMSEIPKYYLADVPHDLRTQLLDRCSRRLFHEALELLHENDIYHYNRDDLINFYNWAPSALPQQTSAAEPPVQIPRDYPQPSAEQVEEMRKRFDQLPPAVAERADHGLKCGSIDEVANLLWRSGCPFTTGELYEYRKTLFPPNAMVDPYTPGPPVLRPESAPVGAPSETCNEPPTVQEQASSFQHQEVGIQDQASSIQSSSNENSEPQTLDSEPATAPPPPPSPVARKRRGKIAALPKDIREELNARLEANHSYETIIRWLARKGHPGFNKQNLHLWKEGGYQDWRRENERIQGQVMQREWLNEQVAQTKPGELFLLIDQLFVTQLLDSLFGLDTGLMKKGLAASPRHYISLFSAYNRFKRHAMNSDEFRAFLERQRKIKQGAGLTDEARQLVMDQLREVLRIPASAIQEVRDPTPSNIVKDSQR